MERTHVRCYAVRCRAKVAGVHKHRISRSPHRHRHDPETAGRGVGRGGSQPQTFRRGFTLELLKRAVQPPPSLGCGHRKAVTRILRGSLGTQLGPGNGGRRFSLRNRSGGWISARTAASENRSAPPSSNAPARRLKGVASPSCRVQVAGSVLLEAGPGRSSHRVRVWRTELIGNCISDAARFRENCFCVGFIFDDLLPASASVNPVFRAFSLPRRASGGRVSLGTPGWVSRICFAERSVHAASPIN